MASTACPGQYVGHVVDAEHVADSLMTDHKATALDRRAKVGTVGGRDAQAPAGTFRNAGRDQFNIGDGPGGRHSACDRDFFLAAKGHDVELVALARVGVGDAHLQCKAALDEQSIAPKRFDGRNWEAAMEKKVPWR